MHEIFSRVEYYIDDETDSDVVFSQFRKHFDYVNTQDFVLAIRQGKQRSVIILTGNEETHIFLMLLLAGQRNLNISIYKGKDNG